MTALDQDAIAALLKRVEKRVEKCADEREDIRAAAQQLLRSERSLSKGVLDFLLRCAQ